MYHCHESLDTLRSAGNTASAGVWSNGTTVWIADTTDAALYAYTQADGARDANKDITLHSDNSTPAGIWSDDTTFWVADQLNAKVFAYTLSDRSRDLDKDISLTSDNTSPHGIWSDDATMWVVDSSDGKLYAHDFSGSRVTGHDISLHSSNENAAGMWGNDDTAWVVNNATGDGSPFNRAFTYNNVPVTVSLGSATYSVDESDDSITTDDKENEAVVTVKLSADPERTVTIPITKANQGGATSADYSGVPASVTFNSGDTSKTFTFSATSDIADDDNEKVKLTFGATLPTGVSEGTTRQTIVPINDDDESTVI